VHADQSRRRLRRQQIGNDCAHMHGKRTPDANAVGLALVSAPVSAKKKR
jgi:hypothetical protein